MTGSLPDPAEPNPVTGDARRRDILLGGAAALGALASIGAAAAQPSRGTFTPARYSGLTVIDCLASPSSWNVPIPPVGPLTAEQLQNVKSSGMTAINLTVGKGDFPGTVREIAFWTGQADAHPDRLRVVRRFEDIAAAKAKGQLGLIYGFQGAQPIGADIRLLDVFRGLGVRIIQLTYSDRNLLGDGCLVPENQGLTQYGRDVVARLNDLRIVVDLAHSGRQTAYEGLTASRLPPIISHTGCRAVYDHPRNSADRELKACADKGGVVGIYLMPFLGGDPVRPTRRLVVRHIQHALNVCGEDHVGIGSDLSITPIQETPAYMKVVLETNVARKAKGISAPREDMPVYTPELNSPDRMQMIAEALCADGCPPRVADKVLGSNFDRVFREVWAD